MKFKRVYEALKRYGFSPAKAAEITLDAKRRKSAAKYAMHAVRVAFKARHA